MASAIYDPLSRIDLPAPRHAVESDEEDDSDDYEAEGDDAVVAPPRVTISPEAVPTVRGLHTLVLIDQLGESMAQRLQLTESARIECEVGQGTIGGKLQIGAVASTSLNGATTTVLLLSPGSSLRADVGRLSLAVRAVLAEVRPSSLQVISSYRPSLYISSASRTATTADEPPLRYLASSSAHSPRNAQRFESPNYLSSTVEACVLQESVFLGISSAIAILVPLSHPQSQCIGYVAPSSARKRRSKKKPSTSAALEEEFPSDDDEDEEQMPLDQPDSTVASVLGPDFDVARVIDDVGVALGMKLTASALPSDATSTHRPLAEFIATRRHEALRNRRNIGGMYM